MAEQKNSRTGWIPTLIIIVLCCLVAWLAANWLSPRKENSIDNYIELPIYATQDCAIANDGVAYYDGSMLYVLNDRGQQRWSYLAGANAGFSCGEMGITTWTGSLVTLLDHGNGDTIFSISTPKPILSARAGSNYVAVCTGTETDVTVVIFDKNGKQIDSIDRPNVTILDYGFFSNGNLFYVSSLDTDTTVPMSMLNIYKPGKMETGAIVDSDQVVYKTFFYSTQLRTVGTVYMRSYDYTGAESKKDRTLVYGWYLQDLYGSSETPLMVFVPMDETGGTGMLQDVRLIQGKNERVLRLPTACFDIRAQGNCVYGFTKDYLLHFELSSTDVTAYAMPMQVNAIKGITPSGKALVLSGSKLYLVELPK